MFANPETNFIIHELYFTFAHASPDSMTPTRDEIQTWLRHSHGGDRAWLAAQCGIALGTLHNSFASGKFSPPVLAVIALLMKSGSNSDTDLLRISVDEFETIDRARCALGYESRPEFYHDAILEAANAALEDESKDRPGSTPFPMPQERIGDGDDLLETAAEGPAH